MNSSMTARLKAQGVDRPSPEQRLLPMIWFSPCVPAGLFFYGWTVEYKVHWIAPIIGTVFIGFGAFFVLVSIPWAPLTPSPPGLSVAKIQSLIARAYRCPHSSTLSMCLGRRRPRRRSAQASSCDTFLAPSCPWPAQACTKR